MRDEGLNHCEFPKEITQGIKFNNIGFKYRNTNTWVLQGLNFTIKPGETIAIVGANGSGKTTLIKLLAGLYEPTEGKIFVDATDWSSIRSDELAKNVSVIFQDFMLYNVSAQDNIWYGNVQGERNDELIHGAAKDAGVHNLFSSFAKGYDTTLGNLFKGSQPLSQGEWQRTALARSFYNQATLILLDEPTSSLDAFTEAKLLDHFKSITQNRTAVIVSHRLSTIKLADRIVVLDQGRMAEIGSPHELEAKKGHYKEMVDSLKR